MSPVNAVNHPMIDLAVRGLQEERTACVARLQQVLSKAGYEVEISGYLKRIDNINAAMVRLAGSYVGH